MCAAAWLPATSETPGLLHPLRIGPDLHPAWHRLAQGPAEDGQPSRRSLHPPAPFKRSACGCCSYFAVLISLFSLFYSIKCFFNLFPPVPPTFMFCCVCAPSSSNAAHMTSASLRRLPPEPHPTYLSVLCCAPTCMVPCTLVVKPSLLCPLCGLADCLALCAFPSDRFFFYVCYLLLRPPVCLFAGRRSRPLAGGFPRPPTFLFFFFSRTFADCKPPLNLAALLPR
jgi:hypothetical protein